MRIVRLSNKLMAFVIVITMLSACQNSAQRAEEHQKFGTELFKKGKYRKAALEFNSALKEDGTMAVSYYYLALLNEKNRNFKGMRANLKRAIQYDPEYIEARIELGKVQLLFNDLDAVLIEADEILKYSKDNVDGVLLKAGAFVKQNKEEDALALIEGILQKQPGYVDAISLKALILMKNEQFDSALQLINPIIDSGVDDISLHLLKIKLDAKQKDINAVIVDYQRLAKLYPKNQEFKIALAKIFSQADRKEEAEKILREIVAAEPLEMQRKLVLLDFLNSLDKERVIVQLQKYTDENQDKPGKLFQLCQWLYQNSYLQETKVFLSKIDISDKSKKIYRKVTLLLAKVHFQSKELEKSTVLLDELIQNDSENLQAQILKAKIYLIQGNMDKAKALLTKVVWANPKSDESLVLMAQIELAKGLSENADKKYREALEINPANLNALTAVVNRVLRNNDKEYASELIRNALKLRPNNVALLRDLAEIKMLSSDWDGAKEILESLQKQPEGDLLAKFLTGKLYKEQGDCTQAVSVYKEVLTVSADFPDVLRQMASCYELMGQRPQLIAYMTSFMEKNPKNIVSYLIMGQLLTLDNNVEKAEELYKQALNINNKIPQIYAALAKLHDKQNNHEKVIETYKLGLEQNVNNVRLSIYLAAAYQNVAKYAEAAAIYESLLAVNPNLEIVINNYAALLVDFISDTASLEKARQLVVRFEHSDNPFYLDSFAWTELKSGNVNVAIPLLEKVNIMAQLAVFKFHLGVAYHEQGNNAGAVAQLQQAVDLGKKKGGFDESELALQLLEKLSIAKNM